MLVQKELSEIMGVFAGVDGGVKFFRLRAFLEAVSEKAEAGDAAANAVLNLVRRFHAMIGVAIN